MRNAKLEPTPQAALMAMSATQNILVFPSFVPIMRRMRARTEHLARLRAIKVRITDARAHCQQLCQKLNKGIE
jgi:hypothetical protein